MVLLIVIVIAVLPLGIMLQFFRMQQKQNALMWQRRRDRAEERRNQRTRAEEPPNPDFQFEPRDDNSPNR